MKRKHQQVMAQTNMTEDKFVFFQQFIEKLEPPMGLSLRSYLASAEAQLGSAAVEHMSRKPKDWVAMHAVNKLDVIAGYFVEYPLGRKILVSFA